MRCWMLAAAAAACLGAQGAPAGPPAGSALARRAEAIRPAPEELRWREIPWITDLVEGQRQARAERRPIFLWVTGDDPLERC